MGVRKTAAQVAATAPAKEAEDKADNSAKQAGAAQAKAVAGQAGNLAT